MADGDCSPHKPNGLGVEAAPSSVGPNPANRSKFYSQFLYKSLTLAIFLVILPLIPSEAPEFVNQTIPTRGWELLHLLIVGIAVSYGLFSRRSDEPEKENIHPKFDNAQSYVSRLLQVSLVFDDEAEVSCGSDENKVQTWSSQCHTEEPVVMVAQESSFLDDRGGVSSEIHEKPLILPVRSLKSRVSDSDVECIKSPSHSLARINSNPGSKRFSKNSVRTRVEEFGDSDGLDLEEEEEDLKHNVVLQSPIPWRLRSGRMEINEELDGPPFYSLPPSMEETELIPFESKSSTSQMSRSPSASSAISLPKELSPSPSLSLARNSSPSLLSSESQAKSAEDMPRKGIKYKMSSPPPPAPPPPLAPPVTHKNRLGNSNPWFNSDNKISEDDFWQCITNESNDLTRSGKEELLRRANSDKEANPKTQTDRLLMGKSVRTVKSEPLDFARARRMSKSDDTKLEKGLKEVESAAMEKTGRKMMGSDEVLFASEERSFGGLSNKLNSPVSEFREGNRYADKFILGSCVSDFQEEEKEYIEDFILASNKESDSEEQCNDLGSGNNEARSSIVSEGGPDVDKKADEFIAKFREQIRLQRIDSFRRSSKQISRRSPR